MSFAIESSEKKKFAVSRKAVESSQLLTNMIQDLPQSNDDCLISMPEIKSDIIEKVLKCCDRRAIDMEETDNEPVWSDEWYQLELDIETPLLVDVIKVADYFIIAPLLELCCKLMVRDLQGLSERQIKEKFDIRYNLLRDEEELLKNRTKWCKDPAICLDLVKILKPDKPYKEDRTYRQLATQILFGVGIIVGIALSDSLGLVLGAAVGIAVGILLYYKLFKKRT
ncbi:hypothetical protein DFQ28_001961 [Apophysomyces sp. BC1034]|nr:hypothetical protein DFQ30_002314 [Apophysomyces sp. BC1015]KAG0179967.1 hypothetical protein DFQ29_001412 [Apophysomyces sp. BC1021]KAG0190522.1 hypothetical protein DFQ28_001961 [Apophysomyces sp. BC1034]